MTVGPGEMLEGIPTRLRAGDTWKWRTAGCGEVLASAGWALETSFRGPGTLDVTGTGDGSGWVSTATAAATENLAAGRYTWITRAAKDDEVFTLAAGNLEVLPDLAAADSDTDLRSPARRMLDACEATIEALVSKQHQSATFGDQSYSLQDIEKLYRIRDRLRQEVANEEQQANGGRGRRILITFAGP